MGLLLFGVLQQVGALHLAQGQQQQPSGASVPELENDGPPLGSRLPDLAARSINGFGTITLARADGSVTIGTAQHHSPTLLVFLSAMCDMCQLAVEPLNALVDDNTTGVRSIAIMRADEHACTAFLNVFPLRVPTICDAERTITMGFDVHRAPFGLLYDERGILERKGLTESQEDFQSLLGTSEVAASAESNGSPMVASAK
jgi:hypothetical protein